MSRRDLKTYLLHKDDWMEKMSISIGIYMADAIYARNVTQGNPWNTLYGQCSLVNMFGLEEVL